jgi:hypothetical protein
MRLPSLIEICQMTCLLSLDSHQVIKSTCAYLLIELSVVCMD